MSTIETRPIESSKENARYLQELAFMHFAAGRYAKPERYANPENSLHINRQRVRLKKYPSEYTGVYVDQKLAGYIQMGDWTAEDQEPYARPYMTPDQINHFTILQEVGLEPGFPAHLGIFGFALDKDLSDDLFDEGAERLLDIATDRAVHLGKTAINVAFHEHDSLQPAALEHGFQFTGRFGITTPNHRGSSDQLDIIQRLYTKPLDL